MIEKVNDEVGWRMENRAPEGWMLLVPSDGVCVVGKGEVLPKIALTLNLGLRIRPELPVEKSGRVMRIWAELGLGRG